MPFFFSQTSEIVPEPAAALSADAPPKERRKPAGSRKARIILTMLLLGSASWSALTFQQIDRIRDTLEKRAENLTLEQKSLGSLEDQLGYGGFLGAANRFAEIGGQAQLDKMHASLDAAEQTLMPLTAAAYSHAEDNVLVEVRSIFELYRAEMNRSEQDFINRTHDPNGPQTLLMLATSLPELTQRLQSLIANRNVANLREMAQAQQRLAWLLVLFLLSAAAASFHAYRRLEQRYRKPIGALAEIVSQWRRDSLEVEPVGRDRGDSLGLLARELDLLRLHFKSLPDLTLTPEKGQDPVRLKFDGQTRTLFEALLRQMVEAVSALQTAGHGAATAQNQAVALTNEMQRASHSLEITAGTAKELDGLAAKANGGIERLLDLLQTRVESLSELTSLTGREVADALRSILVTERTWREASQEGQSLIGKFGSTADELSERLSTAINLLRASGKTLNETAEESKGNLGEILALLRKNNEALQDSLHGSAQKIESVLSRAAIASSKSEAAADTLDQAISGIRKGSEKLGEQLLSANTRFDQIGTRMDALEQVFGNMISSLSQKSRQLVELFETLQTLPTELRETITAEARSIASSAEALAARGHTLESIGESILAQTGRLQESGVDEILNRLMNLSALADDLARLTGTLDRNMPQIADAIAKARSPEGISLEAIQRLNETLDANIAATEINGMKVSSLLQNSRDHIGEMLQRLRHAQEQAIEAASTAALMAAREARADSPSLTSSAETEAVASTTRQSVKPRKAARSSSAKAQKPVKQARNIQYAAPAAASNGSILGRFKKQTAPATTPALVSTGTEKKAKKSALPDIARMRLAAEALSTTASVMLAEAQRHD